jgi:radical SAM protein with 4Fe4S-binding SPASM domain
LKGENVFRINPAIKWRWEGKKKILTNKCVVLDGVAGEILELCKTTSNLENLMNALGGKYTEMSRDELKANVERVVDLLMKINVLIPEGSQDLATPSPTSAVRHITSHLGDKLSAPVWILALLTYCCPARCQHCFVPITKRLDPKELKTEEWKKLIDELADIRTFSITFSGGEPLARKDLEEIIEHADKRGLHTALQTNCFLLDERRVKSVRASGLKEAWISLDGAKASTHDSFRRLPGLFDRVIEAVPMLVKNEIRVGITSIISKNNINEVADIMELAHKIGSKHIALGRPVRYKQHVKELEPDFDEFVEAVRQIHEKEKELHGIFVSYPPLPVPVYEKSIGMEEYGKKVKSGQIGECDSGLFCAVNPFGGVTACDACCEIVIGNIRKKSFKKIWDSSSILRHLRRITKKEQNFCRECSYNEICRVGCKALPWQVKRGGQRIAVSPECEECYHDLITPRHKAIS